MRWKSRGVAMARLQSARAALQQWLTIPSRPRLLQSLIEPVKGIAAILGMSPSPPSPVSLFAPRSRSLAVSTLAGTFSSVACRSSRAVSTIVVALAVVVD